MVNHIHRAYFAVIATVMTLWAWIGGRVEAALLLLPPRSPVVGPARRERGPQTRVHGRVEGWTMGR